jgi:NAD+ diphosphatase
LRNDPDWVAAAWQHRQAQVIGVDGEGRLNATGAGLEWAHAEGPYDSQRHHLVGLLGTAPVFATAVETAGVALRAVIDALPPDDLEMAFAAVGLVGWHRRSGYCPACGGSTVAINGGAARLCAACGTEDYPRSDPAVIVAVTDADGRLLLARQPSWPPRRYSVLAGFAEVGESLEQTVHREIAEESGLELAEIGYLGSQSWPFPRSLMIAYQAVAVGTALRPAPSEIEEATWFSVAELRAALAEGRVELPAAASISRRMIQAWLAGRLDAETVG